MLHRLVKVVLLTAALGGLCPPVLANTTASSPASGAARASAAPFNAGSAMRLAQSDITIFPGFMPAVPAEPAVSIALLIPTHSEALGSAADAVRAGFMAAYEQDQDGMSVTVVETGDAAPDVLSAYVEAAGQHDIVVGPLSRSGVTAVAQSGEVRKPTIALTQPDLSADVKLPQQMLVIGLSIEDEARQAANWAATNKKAVKAVIVSSNIAWQQRAANAFADQWQKHGRELEAIELPAFSGYLTARDLAQLKTQFEFERPDLIFAALDERQAKQLRAAIGHDIPLYGTSQLNPLALPDWSTAERTADMNGTRLLDIPWQLQTDHPAVMAYPRPAPLADQKRSADIERLYALGIDAYRIAREIGMKNTNFELDGVTGKLKVKFDTASPHFERTVEHAIYRDGGVAALRESH